MLKGQVGKLNLQYVEKIHFKIAQSAKDFFEKQAYKESEKNIARAHL